MKRKYAVITGDLVKSREILERYKVQIKLQKVLNAVNKEFKDDILVNFSITLGDEFQGLLDKPEKSFDIIKEIQKEMYPVKISFGIGYGTISTKIAKKTTEMDGECFRKSREALLTAKKLKQEIIYNTGTDIDLSVNTILRLMYSIKSDWKKIHYHRIWLYEKLGTLEKVAKVEKITKQMVSKMFIDIKYEDIRNAEETVKKLLSTL